MCYPIWQLFMEWFCVLQCIYQLPTHKNLSSISPSHDTHKMSFTSKSLNTQGQGIDISGKKSLPYTNLPLLIRNWTVQTCLCIQFELLHALWYVNLCVCIITVTSLFQRCVWAYSSLSILIMLRVSLRHHGLCVFPFCFHFTRQDSVPFISVD